MSPSAKNSLAPCTNGLVEVRHKYFGIGRRVFSHATPGDWCIQVHLFAYAHNTQLLSPLHVLPYAIISQTSPRISLNFQLNLSRKRFFKSGTNYCSD